MNMNAKEIKELKRRAEWKGDIDAAKKLAIMYRTGSDGVELSIQEAMKWYKKAANKGDAIAMGWVGWLCLGNMGYEKDEANAYKWLKKACKAGDVSSNYHLAMCYRKGTGVKENIAKSIQWLQKGVEEGCSNSMYELALMYMHGRDGVEKNEGKAAYYMEMSALHNKEKGMYYYGNFCNEGIGVAQDNIQALTWWKKSAEAGCVDAMFALGKAYLTWNFTPNPEAYYKDGIRWLKRADKEGHKEAAFMLGEFYKFKVNDSQLAIQWYEKSAEDGNTKAMYMLYICYVKRDENTEAIKWLKKSAEAGYKKAMSRLGVEYMIAERVAPDCEKAKYYLEKGYDPDDIMSSAALGQYYSQEYYERGGNSEAYEKAIQYLKPCAESGDKEIMFRVGSLYMDANKDSEEHMKEAEHWFYEAAKKEHPLAMYHLALMYLDNNQKNQESQKKGREWMEKAAESDVDKAVIFVADMYFKGTYGADVDYPKAVYWLKFAVDKYKNPRAYTNLGILFAKGLGVNENLDKAFKCIRRGAELEDHKAYYNLGYLYKNGWGVTKDYDEAIKWFEKAIEVKYSEKSAIYEIGIIYKEKGNKKGAIEWLTKAVEYGVEDAKKDLNELYELMANEKSAMEELESYIGLNKVKQKMRDLEVSIKMKNRRKQLGQDFGDSGFLHMVFTGNPGTGKTEVAKIVAKVLCEIGVLSNPEPMTVERGDLVAEYVGQTEKKTNEVIEKALGGVLFIDEAYTLSKGGDNKDYGQEAIDTLLTAMVKHRDNLVVIVAGYTNDMERFLEANQGLKSRFGEIFEFEDYTADELYAIFERLCQKRGFTIEENARNLVKEYLAKQEGNIDFGNARGVGRYFQEIQERQDRRLHKLDDSAMDEEELKRIYSTFIVEDVEKEVEKKQDEKSAMEELESYIGLEKVKQKMRDLQISVKMKKRRQELGQDVDDSGFLHMIFTGNPGTGKTEVAKIVARVLCEMGVLSNTQPLVVERGDLVAEYIGQTEKKTNAVINKALGGVLFIDEAYTLSKSGGNDKDFGQEAIDALLTAMVKYRDKLVVIAAGYTEDMERFLESNKGLKSRFGEIVEFEDYTADELYAIFSRLVKNKGFILNEKAEKLAYEYLSGKAGDSEFGNGRGVGRYFQRIREKQDIRLHALDDSGMSDEEVKRIFMTFTEEDVMGAYA